MICAPGWLIAELVELQARGIERGARGSERKRGGWFETSCEREPTTEWVKDCAVLTRFEREPNKNLTNWLERVFPLDDMCE